MKEFKTGSQGIASTKLLRKLIPSEEKVDTALKGEGRKSFVFEIEGEKKEVKSLSRGQLVDSFGEKWSRSRLKEKGYDHQNFIVETRSDAKDFRHEQIVL